MRDFFKPWRRKLGVLTLALACALTMVWVRGQTRVDLIEFPMSSRVWHEIAVSDGIFRWWKIDADSMPNERSPKSLRWRSMSISHAGLGNGDEPIYRWRENRLKNYKGKAWQWCVRCDLFIPFWQIVIPLTLLSAWLLLSKPRPKRTQTVNHA